MASDRLRGVRQNFRQSWFSDRSLDQNKSEGAASDVSSSKQVGGIGCLSKSNRARPADFESDTGAPLIAARLIIETGGGALGVTL